MAVEVINQGESLDITIPQGAVFRMSVFWEDADGDPIPLTGYSAQMDIRKDKELTSTLYDSLTSAAGEIVITEALGQLDITFTTAQTLLYTWYTGWYDILVTLAGENERLAQGKVISDHGVTDV